VDLNGDGIETVGLLSDIHFDHGGDGFRELTGWAGAGDGFLALDRNGDGIVSSGAELFGSETLLSDGSKAMNGFEALEELDSNQDGVIDASDELFGDLRIFQDLDQDGETDHDELLALEEAGIQSLSLAYNNQSYTDEFGNEHRQVGSYMNTLGQTMTMTDVWFTRNLTQTTTEQVEVSVDIGSLPDVQGFGQAYSLHQAMVRDESGELQNVVEQFVNAETREQRLDLLEQVIFEWTGQEGDYQQYFQSPIDARKIGALEVFYGFDIPLPRGSGQQYAAIYGEIFDNWSDKVFYQLTADSHLEPFFREISWEKNADTGVWEGDFSGVVDNLFDYAEAHPAQAQDILQDFAQAIRGVNPYNTINEDLLRGEVDQFVQTTDLSVYSEDTVSIVIAATLNATDGADTINGNANNNILFGLDGNDNINSHAGDDVLDGGAGEDVLAGGAGNDEYRFGIGYGRDRVRNADTGSGRYDVVRLIGGLTADDVSISRQGDDLVIVIDGTDDVLRVESHFDQEGTSQRYIDAIVFDDGATLEVGPERFDQINVASQSITEGNDELHGTSVGERINGQGGDDRLYGKDGSDLLLGEDGHDALFGDSGNDWLIGGSGNDQLRGGEGDDYLVGGVGHDDIKGEGGSDVLRGGQGDDLLSGGAGDDYYQFNLGDGLDVIDNQGSVGDVDDIMLGKGILSEDVLVRRSGNDMMIIVREGVDEIRIRNYYQNEASRIDSLFFKNPMSTMVSWDAVTLESLANQATENADELQGGSGADTLEGLGGDDLLVGAGGDDFLSGSQGNDTLQGDDGNDQLSGDEGNDALEGGRGNDTLAGGLGDDLLIGGAGSDTYVITADGSHDVIRDYDNRNVDLDRIVFADGIAPTDVSYSRTVTDLVVTIDKEGVLTSVTIKNEFSNSRNLIDQLEFSDGSVVGIDTVLAAAATWVGTEANEVIYGYAGADNLDGAGGNDTLYGAAGDDVLSGGEGNDRVYGQDGDDIVNGDAGDDYVYGNVGDDLLSGGDGRDRLYGGAGNDTLRGDGGTNDYLSGDAGNDTYLFGVGDGDTTINNHDTGADRNDVLRFLGGIESSDVRATRSSDNLLLTVQSTGEVITVQSYFNDDGAGGYALDAIEFADSTVWDAGTVKDLVQQSTEGADQLYGYAGEDTLGGAGGNDTLYGAAGDDVLGGGDGNDRLYGQDGNDVLNGDTGDDDLYGNAGDDVLNGGGGRDRLYGGAGNDILRGGAGTNDYLSGDSGNDTYLFSAGDGNTTIYNRDTGEGRNDTLRLLEGIDPSDVHATRAGINLLLTVASTGEIITVQSYFSGDAAGGYALDAIEFADGTVWDIDAVKGLVQQGTEGADQLYGYAEADTINGDDGNDTLYGAAGDDVLNGGDGDDNVQGQEGNDVVSGGAGDDRLYGNDGSDTLSGEEGRDSLYGGDEDDDLQGGDGSDNLYGGSGSDILAGGTGNDDLRGDQGDDVYRFSKGDGTDSIYDSSGQDRIEFTDVDSTEVVVRREGDHLRITIPSTGDSVLIERQFNRTDTTAQATSLETVDFADGVSWSFDDLMAEAVEGTEGDDVINGFTSDETINGGDGADEIYGHEGADTILGGAGNDDLEGGDGQDELFGGLGDDQLRGGNAADALHGGEGSDVLYGGDGADLLAGGLGNDDLRGDQGDDVYRFSKGDGADTLYDAGGQDRIEFTDVASSEVVVRREGDHLLITVPSTGDSVFIDRQFDGTGTTVQSTSLEGVDFSDGVSWTFSDLMDQAVAGTSGDDLIQGFSQDETINGGDGADEIYGHEGADTILGGAGNDDLEGGEGQDELLGGLGDDELRGGAGADTLQGGAGADNLFGGDGSDQLAGDQGNDRLMGEQGDDVYRFSKGDGADTLYDAGGQDRIEFTDVASSEVVVRREGDHLRITVPSTGDSIFIERQFDGTGTAVQSTSLETVDFSDGVSWTFNDLMNQAVAGTAGDDLIQGFSQDETISGGDGADEIYGHEGADTIFGGAGNDELDGGDGEDSLAGGTGDDVLRGGAAADTLQGGDGADTLYAGEGNDTLLGDAGNDELHGGAGNDGLSGGDGADELFGDSGADALAGGAGDDVLHGGSGNDTLSGNAGNDILYGDGGSDTLTGGEGNDELYGTGELFGGNGDDVLEGRGTLDGGAGNDQLQGQGSDTLLGGAGDDVLIANTDPWQETSNILEGGAGADQLFGSYGNDVYRFNLGDGQDVITETPQDGAFSNIIPSEDTLEFGAGISAEDLSYIRSGKDLQVSHANGTDGILIKNWFQEPNNHFKVNRFVFDDGTEWSDLDVEEASITAGTSDADTLLGYRGLNEEIYAGDGNDKVWGRTGNDVLHGEAGNDYLDGEEGDDHLIGGAGDDNLVGRDGTDILEGGIGNDTLQGGTGADVLLGGVGEDALFGGDGNDQLDGGADDDFLEAGAGDDVVNGGAGDDQLNGGMGDDALTGGAGNDMYVFAAGSGHDTIYNADGGSDGVMFTGGATEGRISFTRDGDDLVLLIDEGAEGSVRVVNHFLGGDHAIDWVQPDGGYMISTSQINQRVAAGETNGDYDSVVTGTASGEQLVGGSGRDLLEGLAGNDTLFAMGGDDRLEGGAGDDQLYGGNGSGAGSGTDVLIGGDGNDVLVGEDGNDTLMGGAGNDSYYYKAGQGVDVIDNRGGGSDGVFFLDGLDRNRLSYHQDGNDLVILVDGDLEQQVRVTDHFLGGDHAITYVQPTDGGNAIMAGDIANLLTELPNGTGDGTGGDGSGDSGDPGTNPDPGTTPTPELGGDDVLTGSSGNDILVGGVGNDTLGGGLGNDRLEGGTGDDIYIFTGGQDVLREGGGNDVLRFGAGITFNQVASGLMKSGDDLVLKVNGGPDQVTLEGFFLGGDAVVETIEFETGGQITSGQIYGAFGLSEPTPSAGFAQSVAGTLGDDSALAGGAGSDLVQGFNGNDVLDGAEGNDRLEGGNGDDVLTGGLGADALIGGRGNDLYQFSSGDGQDVIDNIGGGDDTLHFEDITFNQVASGLMKSGNSLVLQVSGGADSVTIRDFFSGGDQSIDQITFGSGGQLTSGQIFGAFGLSNPDPQGSPAYQGLPDERSFGNLVTGTSAAETILASSDADFIDGGAGDDTITGGLGNDYLLGGEGNDTYRFASGDGQDTINNLSNGAGNDQLRFASGIDESQLWFSRDGDDLVTSVLGSDDQVRVQDWYGSDVQKLDTVHTDEAMITSNQLEQLVAAMAAFGAPSGGEVTLTPQEENQVQAAMASSWQPGM
jgi:Ca2+-binding RTX toxin-like protein